MTGKDAPSTDLVIPGTVALPDHIKNPAPMPPELNGLFEVKPWLSALFNKTPYKEPHPEFMEQRMMLMTLQSKDLAELLADRDLEGLQKIVPDAPGMSTGPIMLTTLYVAASNQTEGNPCYCLFSYITKATGKETTTTTGVTQIQIQWASMLAMGIWPIEGCIKRGNGKDRGGRHLLKFYAEE